MTNHRLTITNAALAVAIATLSMAQPAQAAMSLQEFNTFSDGSAMAAYSQLSNLSYRLLDLDPNDGISPSIQFVSLARPQADIDMWVEATGAPSADGAMAAGVVSGAGTADITFPDPAFPNEGAQALAGVRGSTSADWLPTTPLIANSSDGLTQAYLGSGFVSSSSRMTPGQVSQYKQRPYSNGDLLFPEYGSSRWEVEASAIAKTGTGGYGGFTYTQNTDPVTGLFLPEFHSLAFFADMDPVVNGQYPVGQRYILSPQTEVIFEGSLAAYALVNPSALTNQDGVTLQYAVASGGAGISLFRDRSKDGREQWSTAEEMFAAFDYQYAGVILHLESREASSEDPFTADSPATSGADAKDFRLVMSNASDTSINATLGLSALNSVYASGAIVPEPSTYALMGLGLAGIGLAARRRTSVGQPTRG